MNKPALLLGAGALLALIQQQLLLQRPPRLLELHSSTASSGPAALSLRFSRPMDRASLAERSQLQPALPHQWLGANNPLRLLLGANQPITGPIQLLIDGLDQRGLPLRPQRWRWDPRPRLLAVVPKGSAEQLQLLERDGRWQPLSPEFARITAVTPLGDGSGIALASRNAQGERLWLLPLEQSALQRGSQAASNAVKAGPLRSLLPEPLIFTHLSSNQRGDLLVQWSAQALGRSITSFWPRQGNRQQLELEASGPMPLLPEGGALVMPELEGLSLRNLPGRPERRQLLPGSRDLSSFCPVSGRALLVRHWPDFRRSLELVEPGQPPRQLWLGGDAVLSTACDRGGERVWLLVSHWRDAQRSRLLEINRQGQIVRARDLTGWEVEPGVPMAYDPTRQQLLLTLRQQGRSEAQPVLIPVRDLELRPLAKAVRQALWLPPG
ncbi:MAG: hypothetical protein FJ076_10710 [Cyanobacteria bacterium K_DeepCast_35m_m1_288]|nr:hypothetical protein [Cyanobacteria bacterium K_DeepCast_35m_m1_288]